MRRKHDKWFIFPRYRTDVVDTYRLSSQSPNGQNIPAEDEAEADTSVKRQFISRHKNGYMIEADQSQIEIRIAAWLSQDKNMLKAIRTGEDIHTSMAAIMLNKPAEEVTEYERKTCKTRTFRILYGGGASGLAKSLGISKRAGQKLIDEYFETFSGLKAYIDRVKIQVKVDLKVKTPFGFVREFKHPGDWNTKAGYRIQRQAFNTIVQSTAACVTYVAMIELEAEMEKRNYVMSRMVGQVHDSLLIDTPNEATTQSMVRLVKEVMERAGTDAGKYGCTIDIPLKCDVKVGKSWGSMKPYKE